MNGEGIYTYPGTPIAKQFGFTADKFDGILWINLDTVYIAYIKSLKPNKGNTKRFFNRIIRNGYDIKVVQPTERMLEMVKRYGFEHTVEDLDNPQLPRVTVYIYKASTGRIK